MNDREIAEYRHLASNVTLAKMFDDEERKLTAKIIGAARASDQELRNAAIALEVLTGFRRKLNSLAQRVPDEGKDHEHDE
jgi:hypothetical protein